MKNYQIRLIIIFSSLSLIGLIITQAFWIKKAVGISKIHFEHRANVALNSAIEEIKRSTNYCYYKRDTLLPLMDQINRKTNPHKIDSLIRKYCEFNKIRYSYEFAIIESRQDTVIYQTKGFYRGCPDEKTFKHCLSCLYKTPMHIELIFPESSKNLMSDVWKWLILGITFILIIIFCFGFIIFAVFRHKKLSEMKTDFINNMTHEFKTPISTIALASEILVNAGTDSSLSKIQRYSKIIQEENERMQSHVEQVLRMTKLDKGGYDLTKEETDVHELIQNAVHNLCLDLCEKEVNMVYKLEAQKHIISADQVHLTNIIKNLVENAYKYSPESPRIEISTANNSDGILVSIKDNGIGISSDKQKYIFDKFYRVPTGNVHDVKGFGIGLYYVKIMVNAHKGKISVKSDTGKGTRFDIFLPFS